MLAAFDDMRVWTGVGMPEKCDEKVIEIVCKPKGS
jgi:hypothetical protein